MTVTHHKNAARGKRSPRAEKPLHKRFVSSNSTSQQEQLLAAQSTHHSVTSRFRAGEMALELGNAVSNPDQKLHYFEMSERHLRLVREIGKHTYTSITGRAETLLANFYNLQSIALNNSIAPRPIRQTEYERLAIVGMRHLHALQLAPARRERRRLAGNISEISLLLLAQRFGLSLEDDSWTGLPTYVSQDASPRRTDEGRLTGWDMNVFTQITPDQPAEVSYKVQAKTAARKHPKDYAPDITVIRTSYDLTFEERLRQGKLSLPIGTVINEVYNELENNAAAANATASLDARTNLLLDKLG